MGFSQLLGNEHLKAQLSAAFGQNKLSHCFLLSGPEGSGKKTLARLLAAAMECESRDRPCCACPACRKVLSDIHPDVITVDTPERKTVPVERIRALQADAYIRPNEGARKVYLLPRAQALTESAQNALLKLIEEPPPYGVFLLLTDNPEKLLPTVRSRCQLLRLSPLSPAQALPALQERFPGRDEATLLSALRQGGGYLGPAAALLEDEALTQETAALVKALASRDSLALTTVLAGLERRSREELTALLLEWKSLFTRALTSRTGLLASKEAAALAAALSASALYRGAKAVERDFEAAASNVGAGHLCGYLAAELTETVTR